VREIIYCKFGCGRIATHKIGTGWICEKFAQSCPVNRNTMKKSTKGEKNGMYGKHQTVETKEKIGKKNLGNTPWNLGKDPYNKGKTLIEMYGEEKAKEIKEKRSKSVSATMLKNGGGISKRSKFLQGWFESKKCQRKIYYQSSYELAFYRILERSDSVLFFDRPKFSIPYYIDGVIHQYHPDVISLEKDCNFFRVYEIKPENECELEINQIKWETASKIGFENDLFLFTVLSESSLKDEIKLIYKEFNLK